jgi:8-oxo-dGTP diphosphatase
VHRAAFCPRCAEPLVEKVPDFDNRPRRACPKCGFVVYLNPKLAAGTLPVRDAKVALVRRGIEPSKGLWSWPCGYVEIDETLEEAALRETHEESGLVVKLGPMLGPYSYPARAAEGHTTTNGLVIVPWTTESVEGELVAGDDAVDAAWFALDAIPWPELAFDSSRRALEELVRATSARSNRARRRGSRGGR